MTKHIAIEDMLVDLLLRLFSPHELRRLIRHEDFGTAGRWVSMRLPGWTVSPQELVRQTVALWNERDMLDAKLFDLLAQARPHRAYDIQVVRAEWPESLLMGYEEDRRGMACSFNADGY